MVNFSMKKNFQNTSLTILIQSEGLPYLSCHTKTYIHQDSLFFVPTDKEVRSAVLTLKKNKLHRLDEIKLDCPP